MSCSMMEWLGIGAAFRARVLMRILAANHQGASIHAAQPAQNPRRIAALESLRRRSARVLEQAEAAIVETAEAGRRLPWAGAPVQHCKASSCAQTPVQAK